MSEEQSIDETESPPFVLRLRTELSDAFDNFRRTQRRRYSTSTANRIFRQLELLNRAAQYPLGYPDLYGIDPLYDLAVQQIEPTIASLRISLGSRAANIVEETIVRLVGELADVIDFFIPVALSENRLSPADATGETVYPWTEPMRELQAIVSAREIASTLRRVEGLEKATVKATSSVGGAVLGGDFALAAKTELDAANRLRVIAFALAACSVGIAIWVVAEIRTLSWQAEVARLAIAVPILGAAYFASYEARDHRVAGRLERSWRTRIDSLDAFCAPLPEQMQHEIRREFARSLFSAPERLDSSPTLADANGAVISHVQQAVRARSSDA